MGKTEYDPGTSLDVPGLEGTMEYGDGTKMIFDRLSDFGPGSTLGINLRSSMLINDRTNLERVRLTQITGLADDPDNRSSSSPLSGQDGEEAGQMLLSGRTIGLTGVVEAGNIRSMRTAWRRWRSQFGSAERDLLIHHPDEQKIYQNSVRNPSFENDASFWSMLPVTGITQNSLTGGVDTDGSLKVGHLGVTTVGTNRLIVLQQNQLLPVLPDTDVWFTARVRVASASGGTINSITLYPTEYYPYPVNGNALLSHSAAASVPSQTVNNWYTLTGRVLANQFDPGITNIGVAIALNAATAGTFTIQVDQVAVVPVPSDWPSPPHYFDGDTPGYEWQDGVTGSFSYGPCYLENEVVDSIFSGNTPESWIYVNDAGVSLASFACSSGWHGPHGNRSMYYAVQSSASGQTMTVATKSNHLMSVQPGRLYTFYTRLNVYENNGSPIDVLIKLLGSDGTSIYSSIYSPYTNLGEHDVEINFMVPDPCYFVSVAIGCIFNKTVSSSHVMRIGVADPCLVGLSARPSDWNGDIPPAWFVGYGDPTEEVSVFDHQLGYATSARRRIPRPFLIKKVRKSSDGPKLPEVQQDNKPQRDFTMSLRASDPRIYVADMRTMSMKMAGNPKLVNVGGSAFTLETATLPVPAGFTYEGGFITNPGGGAPYVWSHSAVNPIAALLGLPSRTVPNGGVALKTWNPDGTANNRPTQDLVARFYRTSEGYTYTNPSVIIGGTPTTRNIALSGSTGSYTGEVVSGVNVTYETYISALVKRVSSSTWLELRWNSAPRAMSTAWSANSPYLVELWCSHNASGTLTTTRLATFDPATGPMPFDVSDTTTYLKAEMLNNVLTWGIWTSLPNAANTGLVWTDSYAIPSSLQSIIGSSVAGYSGALMGIPRCNTLAGWDDAGMTPPAINMFQSSDATVTTTTMSCPVIGDIATPQTITLAGDLVNPIVSISTPDLDGVPGEFSTAYFNGTALNSNPITIDVAKGTVVDSSGNNQYGMLSVGSDFAKFRPGVNSIIVNASSYGSSYNTHVRASWMDALR